VQADALLALSTVVVQADDLLALSTVVVCPTSSSTPPASFHPDVLIDEEPTRIMCEMIGVVGARALGEHVGHLRPKRCETSTTHCSS